MDTNTQADLHFELVRTISRRVDSKFIPYQVSISDSFYEKYTQLWKKKCSVDFVIEHRPFYAQLTKNCVYDTLDKVDRKSLSKHLAELEALVDISETKEDFYMYFEKKYTKHLPDFSDYMVRASEHSQKDGDLLFRYLYKIIQDEETKLSSDDVEQLIKNPTLASFQKITLQDALTDGTHTREIMLEEVTYPLSIFLSSNSSDILGMS